MVGVSAEDLAGGSPVGLELEAVQAVVFGGEDGVGDRVQPAPEVAIPVDGGRLGEPTAGKLLLEPVIGVLGGQAVSEPLGVAGEVLEAAARDDVVDEKWGQLDPGVVVAFPVGVGDGLDVIEADDARRPARRRARGACPRTGTGGPRGTRCASGGHSGTGASRPRWRDPRRGARPDPRTTAPPSTAPRRPGCGPGRALRCPRPPPPAAGSPRRPWPPVDWRGRGRRSQRARSLPLQAGSRHVRVAVPGHRDHRRPQSATNWCSSL